MRRILTALAMLAAAGAVAASPLTTAHAASRNAPMARDGGVITCEEVTQELPSVMGTSCDTSHWGPLPNFVIRDRSGAAYYCQNGWAEGSLWVRGQNCRTASDG
ncbi:hypothetical protein ACIBO2_48075 [Nonomuraea sp. NPDC050022]|uniref:hypothetical protein n=1 Tax=unclassified Nonomuraea TaxID=2593643 RepID=UPI0033CA6113